MSRFFSACTSFTVSSLMRRTLTAGVLLSLFTLGCAPGMGGSFELFEPVTVRSGAPAEIAFFTRTDMACKSTGISSVSVVTAPKHGTLKMEEEDIAVNNDICRGKRVHGIKVIYTSTGDFAGGDTLEVSAVYPDGGTFARFFVVTVTP